jgi:hypothetical protein
VLRRTTVAGIGLSHHRYSHRCILIEAQKADYPLEFMC